MAELRVTDVAKFIQAYVETIRNKENIIQKLTHTEQEWLEAHGLQIDNVFSIINQEGNSVHFIFVWERDYLEIMGLTGNRYLLNENHEVTISSIEELLDYLNFSRLEHHEKVKSNMLASYHRLLE